jgi:hypothetical protein
VANAISAEQRVTALAIACRDEGIIQKCRVDDRTTLVGLRRADANRAIDVDCILFDPESARAVLSTYATRNPVASPHLRAVYAQKRTRSGYFDASANCVSVLLSTVKEVVNE